MTMMRMMLPPRYPKRNIDVDVVVIVVVSLLPHRVESSRRNCLHRHRQWRKMMTMTMAGEVSVVDEAVVFSTSMNDTDQRACFSHAMTMTMIRTWRSKNNRPPPPSASALGE
jgi:hypothetical protein